MLRNSCWKWFSGSCLGTGRQRNSFSGASPSSLFLEALNLKVEETICREAEGDVFYKLQPDEFFNNIKHPRRISLTQILNEKSLMAVEKALIYIYKIDKIPLISNLGQTLYLNLQTCQMVILASNPWDVADLLWVITAYATFWVNFYYVMRSNTASNGILAWAKIANEVHNIENRWVSEVDSIFEMVVKFNTE